MQHTGGQQVDSRTCSEKHNGIAAALQQSRSPVVHALFIETPWVPRLPTCCASLFLYFLHTFSLPTVTGFWWILSSNGYHCVFIADDKGTAFCYFSVMHVGDIFSTVQRLEILCVCRFSLRACYETSECLRRFDFCSPPADCGWQTLVPVGLRERPGNPGDFWQGRQRWKLAFCLPGAESQFHKLVPGRQLRGAPQSPPLLPDPQHG